jgi:hypothetical protein
MNNELLSSYALNENTIHSNLNYGDRVLIIGGSSKWHSGILKESGGDNYLIEIPFKDKNGPISREVEIEQWYVIPYSENNRIALLQGKIAPIRKQI